MQFFTITNSSSYKVFAYVEQLGRESAHRKAQINRTVMIHIYFLDGIAEVTGSEVTGVYPKVSGLAAWSDNCKWYSSLPLGAVVSLFC
jgi:hypothetical protein